MFKIKVSPEEKIKSVESYLHGKININEIAAKYSISKQSVSAWIRKYQTFGAEGLLGRSEVREYTKETKSAAVEDYLGGKGSQSEICKRYKIDSRTTLRKWVQVYNSHRELRPSTGRGSEIYMTKGRNTTYEERVEIVSYCIEHGNDYTAAIEKYGVSYQQIYSWVRKYHEKGAEGLTDKRGKRKPESEMTEFEKLRAENRMLEARNRRLETENAVLKKLKELERGYR